MHPHEALVRDLLDALARGVGSGVAACYHEAIFFSDPIFPSLRGEDALKRLERIAPYVFDLAIDIESVTADDDGARAIWVARYAFGAARRPVAIRVDSLFAFRDGKIVRQFDRFNFWRWAAQSWGTAGKLFGWFAPVKWWVRRKVRVD